MISERSCDTEGGRNYAEKSFLHHRNKYNFRFSRFKVLKVLVYLSHTQSYRV